MSTNDQPDKRVRPVDLIQFVLWLRKNTDFFSGPNLDQHHPKADEPDFYEVLTELALTYTGK